MHLNYKLETLELAQKHGIILREQQTTLEYQNSEGIWCKFALGTSKEVLWYQAWLQLQLKERRLNLLFVCSRNKWRSRTAETIYAKHPDFNCKSAGTAPSAVVKLNAKHLEWADLVLVMEYKHRKLIEQEFDIESYKLQVLDIPDEYAYMDAELIELLNQSLPF